MNYPPPTFLALLILAPHGAAQSYSTIYNFTGYPNTAAGSFTPLTIGRGGVLYGSTASSIFSLTPPASTGGAWTAATFSILMDSVGVEFPSGLVLGKGGVLYGTTQSGGSGQCQDGPCGTVFSLTPPSSPNGSWTQTTLYNFRGGGNGAVPVGSVVIGSGPGGRPVLYGTTSQGGTAHGSACLNRQGCGTVFSLTPPSSPNGAWTETVLYAFAAVEEGDNPGGPLAIGKDGVLYGTAGGGTAKGGTVFALYPPHSQGGAWAKRTLYTFEGPPTDGWGPGATLEIGPGGVLYGTTVFGGIGRGCENSCGTVFSLTPPSSIDGQWTEAVLYTFPNYAPDGSQPQVLIGPGGVLYGATRIGGSGANGNSLCEPDGCGTVFSLAPPASPGGQWLETELHSFSGPPGDGASPVSGLTIGRDGAFYGTTIAGGELYHGTVFVLKP